MKKQFLSLLLLVSIVSAVKASEAVPSTVANASGVVAAAKDVVKELSWSDRAQTWVSANANKEGVKAALNFFVTTHRKKTILGLVVAGYVYSKWDAIKAACKPNKPNIKK